MLFRAVDPRPLPLLIALLLAPWPAHGQDQPADPPPPQPPSHPMEEPILEALGGPIGSPDTPENRRRARAMLQQRLESLTKEQQAMQEAIAMLDRGEPLDAVRTEAWRTIGKTMGERLRRFRELRQARGEGNAEDLPQMGDDAFAEGPPPRGQPGQPERPRRPGPMGPEGGMPPEAPVEGLLAMLREIRPALGERLTTLRQEDPEEFRRIFQQFRGRLAKLFRDRMHDPERWPQRAEMFRLEMDAIESARRAAALAPAERGGQLDRLREVLGKQFDLRLELAESDLARLDSRSAELRSDIEARKARRDTLVQERVQQMVERAANRREGRDAGPESAPPPEAP
ncbi:MAG: hypothetical protein SFZ24_03460 [Planctomycetota bacterium]|nr:hypothetical protein [Planctomycetota bacterium]